MRKPFDGNFAQTQGFNDQKYRSSYYQFGMVGHNGLDYGMDVWTPILAPHKGIVREATSDPTGYGNYVKVESPDESSVLAHLSKISVSEGQEVQEGQLIGYSGNSGNSTGPHLHWGYYRTRTRNRQNGFNGYIDQTDWLDIRWPVFTITDQTIIDLGDGEKQEVQAIRSIIHDIRRDLAGAITLIEDLRKQNIQLRQDLADTSSSPVEPPTTPDNLEPTTKEGKIATILKYLKELWTDL